MIINKKRKPNLFIVGAPKAGTTFLYEKLKNHPDLFFPRVKELNYFSFEQLKKNSYYKGFMVGSQFSYLGFYNNESFGKKYLVDCSVSYFAYDEVPEMIMKFNQEAKIIIILRNPVKRTFSHYLMDHRMGNSDRPLLDYIKNENDFPLHYHQYINNSIYSKNIKNYTDIFGLKNVFIFKLDDINSKLSELFNFLDIDDITPTIDTTEKINPNKEARNKIALFFQKNRNITEKLKLFIPSKVIQFGNTFLYREPPKIDLSEEETLRLQELLKEEVAYFDSIG